MAASDTEEGGFIRTVTPLSQGHPNREMDAIGWLMFAIMVVGLLPLLPVFLVVWIISKLFGR